MLVDAVSGSNSHGRLCWGVYGLHRAGRVRAVHRTRSVRRRLISKAGESAGNGRKLSHFGRHLIGLSPDLRQGVSVRGYLQRRALLFRRGHHRRVQYGGASGREIAADGERARRNLIVVRGIPIDHIRHQWPVAVFGWCFVDWWAVLDCNSGRSWFRSLFLWFHVLWFGVRASPLVAVLARAARRIVARVAVQGLNGEAGVQCIL